MRATPPQALGSREFGFSEPRLDELLFRYRARNRPELLGPSERQRWDQWRRQRLQPGSGLSEPDLAQFESELAEARATHANDPVKQALLDALEAWRSDVACSA